MEKEGRVYNFNPGPAALPLEVLHKVREELLNFRGSGMSILETSHRSKEYEAVHNGAMEKIRKLLGIGEEWKVLFLQGGASLQFAMVPMNFLPHGKSADYIITGYWSERALREAKLQGTVSVAATTEQDGKYVRIPSQKELKLNPEAAYCHYTSNNTIFGTQWHYTPQTAGVPLVSDMSSDFLSRRINMKAHSLIYAGAQKNAGPAGVTIVLVQESFLASARKDIPIILRYETHAKENSLYNTPPCFAVYCMDLFLDWILNSGGLEGMEKRNTEKGKLLYGIIDKYPNFYRCPVEKESRSIMNVVFRLPSEEMESEFIKEAASRGFVGLKGHRSVGGLRVSMYNAIGPDATEKLVDFMEDFYKRRA